MLPVIIGCRDRHSDLEVTSAMAVNFETFFDTKEYLRIARTIHYCPVNFQKGSAVVV